MSFLCFSSSKNVSSTRCMQSFTETFIIFQSANDRSHHLSAFLWFTLYFSTSTLVSIIISFDSLFLLTVSSLLRSVYQEECKRMKYIYSLLHCRTQFKCWNNLIIDFDINHCMILFTSESSISSSYASVVIKIRELMHWFKNILNWISTLFLFLMIISEKKNAIQLNEIWEYLRSFIQAHINAQVFLMNMMKFIKIIIFKIFSKLLTCSDRTNWKSSILFIKCFRLLICMYIFNWFNVILTIVVSTAKLHWFFIIINVLRFNVVNVLKKEISSESYVQSMLKL